MYLEEQISMLIKLIQELSDKVDLFLPNLKSEKGVIHFLEITKETLNNYYERGYLLEGVHFTIVNNKKIFIPESIVNLKQMGIKGKRTQSTKQEQVNSIKEKLGIAA